MPRDVLRKVEMKPKKEGVRFLAANGEELLNHGQKEIEFMLMEDWQAMGFPRQP